MVDNKPEPVVNYEDRTFTSRDGTQLKLRPIPKLVIERLHSDKGGKPKIPMVKVVIAGQYERYEQNPNDPEYLEKLAEWEGERKLRIMRYILTAGVETDPPPDIVEYYQDFFPHEKAHGIKYIWVASLLGTDAEDIAVITNAIIGQTAITEEGLETAIQSFPSDGQRDGPETVPSGQVGGENKSLVVVRGGERPDSGGIDQTGVREPSRNSGMGPDGGWRIPEQM